MLWYVRPSCGAIRPLDVVLVQAKVEKAATERAKAQKSIEYHKDKLTKEEEKIKVMQKQQQQLQIDFEVRRWTR